MGAMVVVVVAVALLLAAAVAVAVVRLVNAGKQLRTSVDASQQRMQPLLDELREAGETASVELEQLQARTAALRTGTDRDKAHDREHDDRYTA